MLEPDPMLNPVLLWAAAVAAMILGLAHSVLGEKLLISPILAEPPRGVLGRPLARFILRFAWHITTVTWWSFAAVLMVTAVFPQLSSARLFCAVFGAAFLAMGVVDAFGSRGRHVGWPLLVLVGALTLAAAWI